MLEHGARSGAAPAGGRRASHILVVEDDEAIRYGIAAALSDEGYTVSAASSAGDALACARRERPDLAMVDLGLPAAPDGLALARRLRADHQLPLIFVTARGDVGQRLAGFDAGADDYVVKPFVMAELLARVRVVLRRHGHTRQARWEVGALRVDQEAHTVTVRGRAVALTATEFELLAALLRHRGSVLSKTQLLGYARGTIEYGPNVVESHVSNLRRKLGSEAAGLVLTVRGYGYVVR